MSDKVLVAAIILTSSLNNNLFVQLVDSAPGKPARPL